MICERIIVPFDIYRHPSATKDDIGHENLVFESRPKGSWLAFSESFLDRSSNTTDRFDACAFESAYFQVAVEHSRNEGSVLVYFRRTSHELELLNNRKWGIQLQDDSSSSYAEPGDIISHPLNSQNSCIRWTLGTIECCKAVHMLGCIFYMSLTSIGIFSGSMESLRSQR